MKNENIEASMGTIPMGTIVAFALNTVPTGWLLCDGSPIPAEYQALIATLGNNTPNLAGRTLIGTGVPSGGKQSDGTIPNTPPTNNWPLGYTGGEYQHLLIIEEMPNHNHTLRDAYDGGSTADDASNTKRKHIASDSFDNTSYTGGNGYHNTMQPYKAVNFIIYTGVNS